MTDQQSCNCSDNNTAGLNAQISRKFSIGCWTKTLYHDRQSKDDNHEENPQSVVTTQTPQDSHESAVHEPYVVVASHILVTCQQDIEIVGFQMRMMLKSAQRRNLKVDLQEQSQPFSPPRPESQKPQLRHRQPCSTEAKSVETVVVMEANEEQITSTEVTDTMLISTELAGRWRVEAVQRRSARVGLAQRQQRWHIVG
ncbi:hypothetical protein J1N35_012009 [Gossypium stocksii]|uniref:Uncharacterized protein n=1 Tax=Gossypium stocksii TaxID=47602 RepID=A0A9D4AE46_9ROSI|nr:hypothetical protein J1N35_012009 [Gossypium stocksii]